MSHWWQASEQELLAALAPAQHALNAAHRGLLDLVAEITRRGLGTASGYRSDAELLALTQKISTTNARARIDAAADVLPARTPTGDPLPPVLPATAAAVADDAISAEHVAVIRAVLAALPAHLESKRAGLEEDLAGWARTFDPTTVRRLGRTALQYLDPDGPEPRDTDPARTRLSLVPDGAGYSIGGWLDREAHAMVITALSPLAAPVPAADGSPDPRTPAERHGAALVELARRRCQDSTLGAEAGGQRPHLVVTVPIDVLETGQGSALLDFADGTLPGLIAAEDARRLACDAHRGWVRLDHTGGPLDIGRETRVVPRRIRRALHQRDHGCAFPRCTVPAQWTDAHHVTHWADALGRRIGQTAHWADGGATALDNVVLLCPAHHTTIHHSEWSVTITDGYPLFHPPPWLNDPPVRNPLHRPDLPRAGAG